MHYCVSTEMIDLHNQAPTVIRESVNSTGMKLIH